MGKASKEASFTVVETTNHDNGASSNPPSDLTPPSPPRSCTPSAHATQSQPPRPYIRPEPLSAQIPGRANLAARLGLANTINHPRTTSGRIPWSSNDFRLRLFILFVALLSILLFAGSLIHTDDSNYYDDGDSYFIDGAGMGCMAYSFLASLGMFIAQIILFAQKKDKMHPAVPLVFDMLGWAGLLPMVIIFALFGYPNNYRHTVNGFNASAAEGVAIVLMWIAVVVHFIIFVRACKAVDRLRKEIKEMKATLRAYVEMA